MNPHTSVRLEQSLMNNQGNVLLSLLHFDFQLNSPEASTSPLIRCTLVTAVKFILVVTDIDNSQAQLAGQLRHESLDWPSGLITSPWSISQPNTQVVTGGKTATDMTTQSPSALQEIDSILRQDQPSSVLLDFLSRLADPDMLVRRAALIALNTAAHHRPALVRPLLTRQLLYAETVVRKELIREVQMGPFKHYEDDGLDTRKCAFECMATLLETCLDRLVMSEFLEPLIDGLKDHTDIKLMAYQMLQRIVQIRPLEIDASEYYLWSRRSLFFNLLLGVFSNDKVF
ncbi:unnamed protein product [Echinostoma caproni]|uniref:TIP120 domain-containing protein n=1 Tax=Echinostoma caproni TaxID=27848 RepID=A0A183BFB1_9TREM|nr:unnamed protein product [Echinostoma caproni]